MRTVALPRRWPLVGRRVELQDFTELLDDPDCQGLLLHGQPGVGKTRLADECLQAAEQGGRACGRAAATQAAAGVPLGAIAHLLPVGAGADPVALFELTARALSERSDGRRFVMLVDDAHLLDGSSLTLIDQLMGAGIVFLLATVRAGPRPPDALSALWRSDRVMRVDLGDLSRDSVETLLHLAMGGPVDGSTATVLWDTSAGNVLFLRELVLGAEGSGSLAQVDGVWRLTGPLVSSDRLSELVDARLAAVPPDGREALERLALTQPVGLDELERTTSLAILEELEVAGLITVTADGRRQQVGLAHPLHAEVLRAKVPRLRARQLLLHRAGAVEGWGARRREDALRIATWRMDATGTADRSLLVAGARLARYAQDFTQAGRLARVAFEAEPDGESGLLLGESLYELGDFLEAEAVLARAQQLASGDRQVVQIADERAKNLFWGLLRTEDALAVNRAARASLQSADARNELLAQEASDLMFSGHPRPALDLLAQLENTGDLRTRVLRAIPEAPALTVTGQTEAGLAVAVQGYEHHVRLGDQLAIAFAGTHISSQAFAMAEGGRLAEAAQLAEMGYQVATESRIPLGRIWFSLNLGRVSLLQGRAGTAQRWFRECAAICRDSGFVGPRRLAVTGLAVASAWLGDAAGSAAAVAEVEGLAAFGFLHHEVALGQAWAAVAAGDPESARRRLRDAAAEAVGTEHRISAAWLFHDVVRLGDPSVHEELSAIAAACDSPLVAARAGHAEAVAAESPAGLADSAARFADMGALLLAAEAAVAAARAYRRAGEPRPGAAMATQAEEWAAACEGAMTPGLVEVGAAAVPLTRREKEVALLAADGVTSKEIAERLFLSPRTVDNHLQSVYSKLGVTSRADLRAALHR